MAFGIVMPRLAAGVASALPHDAPRARPAWAWIAMSGHTGYTMCQIVEEPHYKGIGSSITPVGRF